MPNTTNAPPPRKRKSSTPPAHPFLSGNALVCGDNLEILRELPNDCIDLIYLDPPFNSNQFYVAAFGDKGMVKQQLRDVWRWTEATERAFQAIPRGKLRDCLEGIRLIAGKQSRMAAYAVFMGRRLVEMHRALKPTGSIYLHCDPNANAYLRVLMDTVFGVGNFRSEVHWYYYNKMHDRRKKLFAASTDTILFYVKDKAENFTFQQLTEPREKTARQLVRRKVNGKMVNARDEDGNLLYQVKDDRTLDNVWRLPALQPASQERIGYPTQKPLALLERIIKASSNPGDLVLDPFCGCGTAADAAASIGRGYLGIDISSIAVGVMNQRLVTRGYVPAPGVHGMSWTDNDWKEFERKALQGRDDSEDGTPGWAWAEDRVAGLLKAVPNDVKVGDGGVDARYFGVVDTRAKKQIVVPIQVKMHRNPKSVGRPDLDRLLGVQTHLSRQGEHAPMSLLISLYPPSQRLRLFAAQLSRDGCGSRPARKAHGSILVCRC